MDRTSRVVCRVRTLCVGAAFFLCGAAACSTDRNGLGAAGDPAPSRPSTLADASVATGAAGSSGAPSAADASAPAVGPDTKPPAQNKDAAAPPVTAADAGKHDAAVKIDASPADSAPPVVIDPPPPDVAPPPVKQDAAVDPGPRPDGIAGTYRVAVTNGANTCSVGDWDTGATTRNIEMTVAEKNGNQVTVVFGGEAGTKLTETVGTAVFEGKHTGNKVTAQTSSGRTHTVGTCTFVIDAELSLTFDGDNVTGTIEYKPGKLSSDLACVAVRRCSAEQKLEGTKTKN